MSGKFSIPAVELGLDPDHQAILVGVKNHCERLLDHTPRFKFFTLHGKAHLDSLFEILHILRQGGIQLNKDDLFVLALALCIHDLGMVVPLREREIREILDGRPGYPDAAALENYVRERHHELLDTYLERDLGFLLGLGVTPTQIALVRDVSRCHRKVVLQEQTGLVKYLGALLRVIDELDIGSARAPADVFLNICDEMDPTSCWHWFKHNITESWGVEHTVNFVNEDGRKRIIFTAIVRPTRERSIDYWLKQIKRPIAKALFDDGAQQIIRDKFGVSIEIAISTARSRVNKLGTIWENLEERSLSSNRKVLLVVDDEKRKLEDLFLPLMDDYHVIFAFDAKDAFSKLQAGTVDLAVVDMQVGSGGLWSEAETQEFKLTGLKLCREIQTAHPQTRVGILTGTRYPVPNMDQLNLAFFLRKPIDPGELTNTIQNALR